MALCLLGSSFCFANGIEKKLDQVVCTSRDGRTQITVSAPNGGAGPSTSTYNDMRLKTVRSSPFEVLEGFSGDHDNFQSTQLTLMAGDDSNAKPAVLIFQDHVDRVGYMPPEVTQLNCEPKK